MTLLRRLFSTIIVVGVAFLTVAPARAEVLVDQITNRALWENAQVVGHYSNTAGPGYDVISAVQIIGNGEKISSLSGLFGTFDTLGHPNAGNIANFMYRIMIWDSVPAFIADPFHRSPSTAGARADILPSNPNYLTVYGHGVDAGDTIDLYRTDFNVGFLNYTLNRNQTYVIAVVPRSDFFSGFGVMGMSTCLGGVGGLNTFWYSSETPLVTPSTFGSLSSALPGVTYRIETTPWCRSDADHNGILSIQDIFTFLQEWFGGSLDSDTDHNGSLSVQDIFTFLQLWFGGTC